MSTHLQCPTPPEGYRRGVGICLLNDNQHIFVGQRIDMKNAAWQMPQGGIDKGEKPKAAAKRELEEETGVTSATFLAESGLWLCYDLPPKLAATAWGGKYRGQAQKWYAMRFTGNDAEININTAHPEFESWRWLPAKDLPHLIVPFKRPLYEAVLEEFAGLWDPADR